MMNGRLTLSFASSGSIETHFHIRAVVLFVECHFVGAMMSTSTSVALIRTDAIPLTAMRLLLADATNQISSLSIPIQAQLRNESGLR
jgi:hypothetical protein